MSKMNIHGSEYPIKKIFSDDFVFTIPLYQRAYAWTIEESEELFQDLIRAMGDAEEAIDDISPYFLGSIVLIKGDEPDAQVVDGQQRLATLTMLLAALRSLIKKEVREKYVHRLGNLVLLSRGKNIRAENIDFDLKKRQYFTTDGGISPFVLTSQVLQHREWTPAIIEQRQNELIGALKQLWRL
jgi:uncharacterized protein with ParB-like and HNH nuclease domain